MHQPPVEPLEGRLLRAAVSFANHVLTVTGTAGVGNTVVVGLSVDGQSVVATDTVTKGTGTGSHLVTVTKSVPLRRKVRALRITTGGGNDSITIDQTYGSFTIRTTIVAGGGNDTVQGGDEPDHIFGNAGDDLLAGGGGPDIIRGGAGNDTLHDASGPDTVLGGAGRNLFQIHSPKRDIDTDFNKTFDTLQVIPAPYQTDSSTTIGDILGGLFPISSIL